MGVDAHQFSYVSLVEQILSVDELFSSVQGLLWGLPAVGLEGKSKAF